MRAAAVFVVVLAACSSGESTSDSTAPTILAPTTATTAAPPVTTIPPFVEVEVALSPDGAHLVDAEGRSLYLFTLDAGRTSACEGACAEAWPPLFGDPIALAGVEQSLLGNAERGNGSIQVTYGGHPLYRYSGDTRPGDTNGHRFNDVWFLVDADGEPVGP